MLPLILVLSFVHLLLLQMLIGQKQSAPARAPAVYCRSPAHRPTRPRPRRHFGIEQRIPVAARKRRVKPRVVKVALIVGHVGVCVCVRFNGRTCGGAGVCNRRCCGDRGRSHPGDGVGLGVDESGRLFPRRDLELGVSLWKCVQRGLGDVHSWR